MIKENEPIGRSCAFTGYRPKNLPWKHVEDSPACKRFKEAMFGYIRFLVEQGITDWFSGMAEGIDTWGAEMILTMREELAPGLRLYCILPCKGQEERWSEASKERYRRILAKADFVKYLNERYYIGCMMERNRNLVSSATSLFAVYDQSGKGDSTATVRYAQKNRRTIYYLNPITLDYSVERPPESVLETL